jgi:hypothetical protein
VDFPKDLHVAGSVPVKTVAVFASAAAEWEALEEEASIPLKCSIDLLTAKTFGPRLMRITILGARECSAGSLKP